MIYIGAVAYGPKVGRLPVVHAYPVIRDALRDELGPANLGASIDIVLLIPGPLGAADFAGLRVGRLSKSQSKVQVEVAIPQDVASSQEPVAPLLALVASAIVAGGDQLNRAGIPFDVAAHGDALRRVAATLAVAAPRLLTLGAVSSMPEDDPVVEVRVPFPASPIDSFSIEDALVTCVEESGVGTFVGNEVGEGEHLLFFTGEDLARLSETLREEVLRLGVAASIGELPRFGADPA